jgi:neurofibromin 1
MRELCSHMHMVVKENYPDSVYTAIGGWVFLRYINPAIISPEIVDLDVPEDAKETRRALVLMSKVRDDHHGCSAFRTDAEGSSLRGTPTQLLQALSNNIRFKEPGMKTLNSFVTNVRSCFGRMTAIPG